jgi:membrane-bound lytic murein transglycosylase B
MYSHLQSLSINFTALLLILSLNSEHSEAHQFSSNIQQESVSEHSQITSDPVDYPKELEPLVAYFDKKGVDIRPHLSDSRFEIYNGISDRFRNSAEVKSGTFEEYKGKFNYNEKMRLMPDFIETHSKILEKAEKEYDIPKYVITAIIGIESSFGKNIGSYNPFNAYTSMIFEDYRAEFATAQLEELLLWTEKNNVDPFELKSSYAGAMAFAQFIPYSLNRWFVGDDIFDMNNNILSVANYLAHFKNITGSVERAVFRYNPSQMYTDAVMTMAKEAEALHSQL